MNTRPLLYGYCFFCEGIRPELHGKYTLVGVYPPRFLVDDFPHEIEKFVTLVTINFHESVGFKNLSILIKQPGDDEGVIPFQASASELEADFAKTSREDTSSGYFTITVSLETSAVIAMPGKVDVSAMYGDESIYIGAIRFARRKVFTSSPRNPSPNPDGLDAAGKAKQ